MCLPTSLHAFITKKHSLFPRTSCSFMTLYWIYLDPHSLPSEPFLNHTVQVCPFPNSSILGTEFTKVIPYPCVYLFSFLLVTTWFWHVYCELFSTGTTTVLEVSDTKYLYLLSSRGCNCQVTNTATPLGSHPTESSRTPLMCQVLGLGIQ